MTFVLIALAVVAVGYWLFRRFPLARVHIIHTPTIIAVVLATCLAPALGFQALFPEGLEALPSRLAWVTFAIFIAVQLFAFGLLMRCDSKWMPALFRHLVERGIVPRDADCLDEVLGLTPDPRVEELQRLQRGC